MVQVKRNLLSSLGAITAALLFASCDSLFHQYRGVGGCWSSSDTLEYIYTSAHDQNSSCMLDIELRCNSNYEYKELFLRVERLSEMQKDTVVDTVMCEIYDDTGRLNGTTAGILRQTSFSVDTFDILSGDTVTIRVSHLMDDEQLQGVSDVGVRLLHCGRHQF